MAFESQSAKMPQGLDLEISHHPLTMRRVVNLVVAMERLKASKSEFSCSTEFRDEDLLNMIVESAIDEQIVLELTSEPMDEMDGVFSRTREHQYRVTDRKKRHLVLFQEAMELHAVLLQGGNTDRIAYLNMSTYIHPGPNTKGLPVTLGIKGTNLYLSCAMDAGKPTLQLEELEDKEQLRRINSNSDMVRFVFFKRTQGRDASSLRSAQTFLNRDDWYISTAEQNSMPVDMCQESSARYQSFTIERQ